MKKYLMRGIFLYFAFISCNWMSAQDLWDGTTATSFHAGNGTEEDPYQIRTGAQLMYFVSEINAGNDFSDKTVKIMNDIDLNNNQFMVTSAFAGTLDGGNHIITLQFAATYNHPLFNTVSGRIHHLGFKTSIASAYNGVNYGGIVLIKNLSTGGILEDCYYKINGGADLFNHNETLVTNNYGTIQNCMAEGHYHIYSEYRIQEVNLGPQLVYTNYTTGIVENCYAYVNDGVSAYYKVAIPLIKVDNGLSVNNTIDIESLNAWVDQHPSDSKWTTTGTYKLADFNAGSQCLIEFIDPEFNQSVPSIYVTTGEAVGSLPTLSGDWTFRGWKRLGQYVSSTDVISSNWFLTAQWEQCIRKQPTALDMSVEVDDVSHASFQWYCSTGNPEDLGQWQSTNHTSESTDSKSIEFVGRTGDVLSFTYQVSSESYDYFYAYLNGVKILEASGEKTAEFSYTIPQDGSHILLLKYDKDDDTNLGSDMVTVTDIKISAGSQELEYTSSSIPDAKAMAQDNVDMWNGERQLGPVLNLGLYEWHTVTYDASGKPCTFAYCDVNEDIVAYFIVEGLAVDDQVLLDLLASFDTVDDPETARDNYLSQFE